MDNITTHVIVPDDEDEFSHAKKEHEYLYSSAMIEDRPVWVEKQIVHPAWVKESLAKKEVQDWLGYQVTTGSAQRATRRREAEVWASHPRATEKRLGMFSGTLASRPHATEKTFWGCFYRVSAVRPRAGGRGILCNCVRG